MVTAIAGNPKARLPMTFDIAMGVRRAGKALKAEVDSALSSLAPQIRTILASCRIPVVWEPSIASSPSSPATTESASPAARAAPRPKSGT